MNYPTPVSHISIYSFPTQQHTIKWILHSYLFTGTIQHKSLQSAFNQNHTNQSQSVEPRKNISCNFCTGAVQNLTTDICEQNPVYCSNGYDDKRQNTFFNRIHYFCSVLQSNAQIRIEEEAVHTVAGEREVKVKCFSQSGTKL